jgi:LPXTG-motif cell wall-anchored protein
VGARNDKNPPYSKTTVEDVDKLYHYLVDKNPGLDQPAPTLKITAPADQTPKNGLIGPFAIATTATGELKLDAGKLTAGVTLTDADGKQVASVKPGDNVYVKIANGTPAGSATFTVSTDATLDTGRIFAGVKDTPDNCGGDKSKCTQPLIVAQASKVTVSAEASVTWKVAPPSSTTTPPSTTVQPTTTTPPTCVTTTAPTSTTSSTTPGSGTTPTSPTSSNCGPTPTTSTPITQASPTPLAYTGASVIGPIIAGIVLIGAGVGALFFVRRRKGKTS